MGENDVKFNIKREKQPMVNKLNYLKATPINKNTQNHRPVNNLPKDFLRQIFQRKHDNSQQHPHQSYNSNDALNKNYGNGAYNVTYPDIKIACILDAIPTEWFKYECTLLPLDSKSWYNQLVKENPHMLLVQSTWHDFKGDWGFKMINIDTSHNSSLKKLVNFCKKKNIPTVFWNIEDPYDFNTFIGAAKLFDHVFTTDSSSISKYKKILKHNRVYALPFAAQPKIHNPINRDMKKKGKVAFAGSWYHVGHNNRKRDMEIILKPALKYKVDIYDRMYSLTKNKDFKFPNIYQPYIKGYLPYPQMSSAYKKYHVFLNVNTVQNSPTMFSCRIFELLASGANVVSGYALGIQKMFPNIVKISRNQSETNIHLSKLLKNNTLRDRLSVLGQRKVFSKHTYRHRIEAILDKVGIHYIKYKKSGVTIITSTIRKNNIDNVFKNYENQKYKKKELIIILNNNEMNIDVWKQEAEKHNNVRVYKLDEDKLLGTCLNYAVNKSKYEYIAKFDDDDYYGPNYLVDIMHAFNYTKADIVGKLSYFALLEDSNSLVIRLPNRENRFVDIIAGSTIVCNKKVFKTVKFPTNVKVGTDTEFLKACVKKGFRIYSVDRFNHVLHRRSSKDTHTWKVDDDLFLKSSKKVTKTDNYTDLVTI